MCVRVWARLTCLGIVLLDQRIQGSSSSRDTGSSSNSCGRLAPAVVAAASVVTAAAANGA